MDDPAQALTRSSSGATCGRGWSLKATATDSDKEKRT
jgi:hypothetical protein